jgi:hypothetical protein
MDNRIGTGRTLARAYGFLFGHIADVIGLGWLAATFYGTSVYFLIHKLVDALLIAPPTTPLVNQFTLPYFAGFLLATAFFAAPMSVAMTRNALGNLESRAGVYFIYGRREIRAFWAFLKLCVIVLTVTLGTGVLSMKAAGIIAARIAPGQIWLNTPPAVWLTAGAAFLTVCVFVFIEARLGFFLAPLAGSGERTLLRYSWQLNRGNSWAVFASTFVMLLSVFGVLAGCYYFFSDSNFNATMIAQRGDPAMWHAIANSALPIAAICAITLTVLSGLFAGASARAYGIVSGNLDRIETEEAPSFEEPVHAMAALARAEPSFPLRAAEEPFAAVEPSHAETSLNVISEPVAAAMPEAAPEPVLTALHIAEPEAPVAMQPAPFAQEDAQPEGHVFDAHEPETKTAAPATIPAELLEPALHAPDTAAPKTAEAEAIPLPAASEIPASPEHAPSEAV